MTTGSGYLGLDVGSVSVSAVLTDENGECLDWVSIPHGGRVQETVEMALAHFPEVLATALTSSSPQSLAADHHADDRVAWVSACARNHAQIGSILIIGAEKFGLIRFDEQGNYRKYRGNTSCAAGTGSFLDQQARRLNLKGSAQLAELALQNRGDRPKIASRCSVFAKTDLIHAQQEGYSLAEICDGLCYGLAKNVVDTLFAANAPLEPLIFIGGVAQNPAVVKHLESILGVPVHADPRPIHGAWGAALHMLEARALLGTNRSRRPTPAAPSTKGGSFPALKLELSRYPDFSDHETWVFTWEQGGFTFEVEVDAYDTPASRKTVAVTLGMDVGSTSTKAVLLGPKGKPLAGFYTRTSGRPVQAMQSLLAAVEDYSQTLHLSLEIKGAATTGSGRKFVGKLMGADLIMDEISAHARAAAEINSKVDTILEIGGQDAKFTTLHQGSVTFSVMNHVCAAGTGSFIEEQAQKLSCPLEDYADRVMGRTSPMASDRCTVFMERDINSFLARGYAREEILACALHAVCENYLTKVAVQSAIGNVVLFQGATAKNRALIAAFEQRLNKPIHVSRYCHLTGALGAALSLAEKPTRNTIFRGLSLHQASIPIRSEVCELCTNHCKITIAAIGDQEVGFGFLCGRDMQTDHFVENNRSGFHLMKQRKRVERVKSRPTHHDGVVAIPAALHLQEDLSMWRTFFAELGIPVITSEDFSEGVKKGKNLAGAEFCAPMAELHGHVHHLVSELSSRSGPRAIFLPNYLERRTGDKKIRRTYCYYTQFSPGLIKTLMPEASDIALMTPLARYLYHGFHAKTELYRHLKKVWPRITFRDVAHAHDRALAFKQACELRYQNLYREQVKDEQDVHVVLLGRPYTALSRHMNKHIPEIFGSLGVKAFYQDMLPDCAEASQALEPLLKWFHWHFAARVLEKADAAARTPGAYPVLITAFKCSPDAIMQDYFKRLMNAHDKPYLILQLDEHDSSVGYETRIESAVRAFRNHHQRKRKRRDPAYGPGLFPKPATQLSHKTLLLPSWDNFSQPLLVAALRKYGLDARLIVENEQLIQRSLRHNHGQCIPLNIIVEETIHTISTLNLDPAQCVLWMPRSALSCNFGMFRHAIKSQFDEYGRGMQHLEVYGGTIAFADISLRLPIPAYFAYLFGGFMRMAGCKIRPRETMPGSTDQALQKGIELLAAAFAGHTSRRDALAAAVDLLTAIPTEPSVRPKVAVFGDFYARDNDVFNQDLVRFIEAHGGEVVSTPYSLLAKMVLGPYCRKWMVEGNYTGVISSQALLAGVTQMEKVYTGQFRRIIDPWIDDYDEDPRTLLDLYGLRIEHSGETMENALKTYYLKKHHPDLALFVQASPAFCCPSMITEALSDRIEQVTGVPMISVTYDGTTTRWNDAIVPYLAFPRTEAQDHSQAG